MQERFSYSKINTFVSCPRKYKIQYIDKISNKFQGIESFMGSVVHMVIYDISRKKRHISLDTILDHYDSTWKKMWHNKIMSVVPRQELNNLDRNHFKKKNKEKYFLTGKDCIIRFVKSKLYIDLLNNKPSYKKGRKIDVFFEKKIEFVINDLNFIGIIDRVDIFENEIIIHDYKTNKRLQTVKQLKNNLQFFLYYNAASQLLNNYNVDKISISIFNLLHNSISGFTYSSNDISKMENSLSKIIANLSSSKYRPKETPLCNWCYYWKECPIKLTTNPLSVCL